MRLHTEASIYAQRRASLMDVLPDDCLAVVHSGVERTRNNDINYPFRVDSDFWYLTGFDEPHSWLVLHKQQGQGQSALFVPPKNPDYERWEGKRLGVECAGQLGCDAVFSNEQIASRVQCWVRNKEWLLSFPAQEQVSQMLKPYFGMFGRRQHYPEQWQSLSSLVARMRWIKDPHEQDLLRQAATINALAHIQCMRQCQVGKYEYQLQAAHTYESMQHGACFHAYAPIVAAGENACILHYQTNTDQLREGDLVLIDAGCEWQYYASDVTRTFPVNGRFSPIQRDIYQLVLLAQQQSIAMCQVGNTLDAVHQASVRCLTQGLLDLGLLQGDLETCLHNKALAPYYMHGTSHWLGLDVHDPSRYTDKAQPLTLQPGVVLTVEPGLYFDNTEEVPQEVRGMGIRIEDDILVTPQQPEILTVATPKLIDDIEAIVGCETGRRTSK